MKRSLAVLSLLCGLLSVAEAGAAALAAGRIRPSQTDSAIRGYDEPHVVIDGAAAGTQPPLVVFMPGTSGKPENLLTLLGFVAQQGYRVIGLEYNDTPAVVQSCRNNPQPDCSGDFREERIFGGDASAAIDTPAAETIVNRLGKLLQHLGWTQYLRNGAPDWPKIIVAGLSQGAGMAAYIAKKKEVARVVLFSSPYDFMGVEGAKVRLAPWLQLPAATPPERWYAEYHRRESAAPLLPRAYAALRIPQDHIRVLDREPAGNRGKSGGNPYHADTAHNPAYAEDWKILFGTYK